MSADGNPNNWENSGTFISGTFEADLAETKKCWWFRRLTPADQHQVEVDLRYIYDQLKELS